MDRSLWFLVVRQRRNAIHHYLIGLKRPRKWFGLLFWIGFVALIVWGQSMGGDVRMYSSDTTTGLTMFLGFVLLASLIGGFMQRGIAFQPSDIDFVFTGPYSRREIVVYRLVALVPMVIVSTLFLMIFVGPRVEHAVLGFVAVFLCQQVAVQLQTAAAIVASAISDRTFGRLRAHLQVVFMVLIGAGILASIIALTQQDGFGASVRGAFDTTAFRVALYPASAAARLANAASFGAAVEPLIGLLALVVVTFVLVTTLQTNFFEASIGTSQRVSDALKRARRGVTVSVSSSGEKVRRVRLPGLPVFRGAGAILWKNLLTVARSLRVVFFSIVFTAIFLTATMGFSSGSSDPQARAFQALAIGAFLPILLQPHLAFDFRRDLDSMVMLKQLPAAPMAIAAAEVAAPTLVALAYQWLFVGVSSLWFSFPAFTWWAVLLVYPVVTLAVTAASNVGFMMFPVRAVTAGGRPNPGGASAGALLNMLIVMVSLVPAAVVGGVSFAITQSVTAVVPALVMQLAVDLVLIWVLGRLFHSYDVSKESS